MELKNVTKGFTENDIENEFSLDVLHNWRLDVEKDISSIKYQIDLAIARYQCNKADTYDPVWLAKAKSSKRMQGILLNKIAYRFKSLSNIYNSDDFAKLFVINAKDLLTKTKFDEIAEQAYSSKV